MVDRINTVIVAAAASRWRRTKTYIAAAEPHAASQDGTRAAQGCAPNTENDSSVSQ
ncbi:hypothetical protein D3C85_700300 [compost metagenome]